MLLGNKCDIEAKRKVSKETGEKVRICFVLFFYFIVFYLDYILGRVSIKTPPATLLE